MLPSLSSSSLEAKSYPLLEYRKEEENSGLAEKLEQCKLKIRGFCLVVELEKPFKKAYLFWTL